MYQEEGATKVSESYNFVEQEQRANDLIGKGAINQYESQNFAAQVQRADDAIGRGYESI